MNPSSERGLPELTVRAIILGGLITLGFTAANVYLGLKVGLTFATSIPAAVISMAVLRLFKSSNIFENNIVQTVASAAGTLSAIIFVLPGLVIVGWWHGFPYWITMAATGLGGILGVMFSVPLRRALVVNGDLPYPEGLAAAEVLLVGAQSRDGNEESRQGLVAITVNAIASAAFFALSQTRLVVDEAAVYFRVGASSTGVSSSLSMALFGVGHLVGISVGMAMFAGIIISWGILVPMLTAALPAVGLRAARRARGISHRYSIFWRRRDRRRRRVDFLTHSRTHHCGSARGNGCIRARGDARPCSCRWWSAICRSRSSAPSWPHRWL